MGLLFGYAEEDIAAPSVSNKYSEPINGNSEDEESCIENKGSYEEYEELLRPTKKDNSNPNHAVIDLSSMQVEDDSTASESSSDSLSQEDNKRFAKQTGMIKGKDDKLLYFDGKRWVPAVYHHEIRASLIERASRKGEYTYQRERGLDPYDVTSYLESQKDWGPVRDENWAEILYIFQRVEGHRDPAYRLKNWKVHGKIVLAGHDNKPMLRFRDLPDTLSSALNGRDMEAMKRTDPRIQQRDFMARMPLHHTSRAGTRKNAQSLSSIGMRMTRFRQKEGMLSWTGREGSKTIRNALWERLPRQNQLANSIRALKPPTEAEQHEIRKGNAGKFLNRAGRRALSNQERERRQKFRVRRPISKLPEIVNLESEDSDEGTKGRTAVDKLDIAGGLAEPDAEQDGHQARHGGSANHPIQPLPTINTPNPVNPYQPEQDSISSADRFVQASGTSNTPESPVGARDGNPSRTNISSPSARGYPSEYNHSNPPRRGDWNSNYGCPPGGRSRADPDDGISPSTPLKNYPPPPEYYDHSIFAARASWW